MAAAGLFFQGLIAGFTAVPTAGALGSILGGAYGVGVSVGAFFGQTVIGSLLLNVGVSYVFSRLNRPDNPGTPDVQVNVRLERSPRQIAAGTAAVGGAAGIFMEFDESGAFWYVIAHADSELTGDPSYILDGIPVELSDGTDGFTAGDVITDDFCVTDDGDPYEGSGTRVPVWRIYTVTPDASNLYGTKPAAFTSAFSNLPADFYGTGVTWSIIRGKPMKPEKRQNGYRWRGPIGVGEPSVVLVGNFTRMYDPREVGHDIDDPSTWTAGNGNPAIVWAWFRTTARGKGQPMSSVNWTKVGEKADICDTTVLNRSGESVPLYRAGGAWRDNRPRHDCEEDILKAMDAFVAYDDEGKSYPVPGYYEAPTLTFYGNRDIFVAETVVIDDDETPIDGVVVEYTSPDHGYTLQPSAPWVNDTWYDGTSEPNYFTVQIPTCQDHNQAVRLGKAIGQRMAPTHKGAFGTTVKGLLATSERGIGLQYDVTFDGEYEIVSPVGIDPSGQGARLAVVPLASDRWTLNEGEEGEPPQPTPALELDTTLEVAQNVTVSAVEIATSSGRAVRLEASFDDPSRVDRIFRFRYVPTAGGAHEYMITDMDEGYAYSAIVEDGTEYRVSWQTVTAGGRATVWSDERDTPVFEDITATADTTPPSDLVAVSATGGSGQATLTWTTANDPRQASVNIYRATSTTFPGSGGLIDNVVSSANTDGGATDAGLAAGTYYYWLAPVNGSGVEGTVEGPESATVI